MNFLNSVRRLAFFYFIITIIIIPFAGCAGSGNGNGFLGSQGMGGAGNAGGMAGNLMANVGAGDIAAQELFFEVNGRPTSFAEVNQPGTLKLVLINNFQNPVTIRIQWVEDNHLIFDQELANVPPGESTTSYGHAFVRTGDHSIKAKISLIDPAVAEDLNNNVASGTVTVERPIGVPPGAPPGGAQQQGQGVDLMWAEAIIADVAGNSVREPQVGEPVKIGAAMFNAGDTTAQNIQRVVKIDGNVFYVDTAPQCDAGQSVSLLTPEHTFEQSGSHTLTLSISQSTPLEAAGRRGNNDATIIVHVRPNLRPAAPGVGSVTVNTNEAHDLQFDELGYFQYGTDDDPRGNGDESSIYPGLPGDFRGFVRNDTNYNESNVGVSVKVNGRSIPGGNVTLEHVSANDRAWFSVPYQFPGPGSYRITCDIDPQNRIRETNESNNHEEMIVNVSNPLLRGYSQDFIAQNIQFFEYSSTEDPVTHRSPQYPVTQTTVGKKGDLVGTFYNLDRTPATIIAMLYVDGHLVGSAHPVTDQYYPMTAHEPNYSFTTPGIHKIKLTVSGLLGGDSQANNNSVERDIEVVGDGTQNIGTVQRSLSARAVDVTGPLPVMTTPSPAYDLVADDVSFHVPGLNHSVSSINVGQTGSVEYEVRERDGKAVNDVPVEVRFLLNGRNVLIIPSTIQISSGQEARGRTGQISFPTPGPYEMVLWVDPNETKNDSNRNTNDLHRSLNVIGFLQQQLPPENMAQPQPTGSSSQMVTNLANSLMGSLTGTFSGASSGDSNYTPTASMATLSTPPDFTQPSSSSATKSAPVFTAAKRQS